VVSRKLLTRLRECTARWLKYRERGSYGCIPPGRRAAPVMGIKRCRDRSNRDHRSPSKAAQYVLGNCWFNVQSGYRKYPPRALLKSRAIFRYG
jgi:hypothetical protein